MLDVYVPVIVIKELWLASGSWVCQMILVSVDLAGSC